VAFGTDGKPQQRRDASIAEHATPRNFDPAYDRFGSFSSDRHVASAARISASLESGQIIGASRGIGLETVKAALEAGHSVRALARSARRIPVDHPKLGKMAGDALELATVRRALTGVDVVMQSLGVSAGPEIILKPTRFFSKATRVLVTAMEEAQVKRLICVTGFGAGDSRGRGGCLYSDGRKTNAYRALVDPHGWTCGFISRADVADFLVKQIDDDTFLHKTPVLTS
jgi:uncharacterized protein YbjT (DUF2867 family)